jgi:sec-independent protein translocase protein TatB
MFDFAWSEIGLIAVVALVLIGPKDLPVAIKAITAMIKKARRMAGEFQTHVDEMVREADLHEVRDQIREFRGLNIKGAIAKAVDEDGALRKAFSDPMAPTWTAPVTTPTPEPASAGLETTTASGGAASGEAQSAAAHQPHGTVVHEAPSFIPPGATPAPAAVPEPPPAFIPPGVASSGAAHPTEPRA